LTSLELQITDEHGKHSNCVKQDGENVQNVDFDSANNAEHSCKGSDNSTKPLHITQVHKQTSKHKRITKILKTRSDKFLWT